ncbi:MAG: cation diffusion facilitator family transporter [Verrucomicrobiae bacterium]|nr:cation diffusion facilitator family transporter [Verrucomicrobiae bacterium]
MTDHPELSQVEQEQKTGAARLSVASNGLLVLLKLAVGIMINSVSVISEAIHSAIDLVAALIALIAVKISGRPADRSHPFGHGKVENISGAVEAILIFGAAGWIIYEAIHKLLKPQPVEAVGWGFAVMMVSAVSNFFISRNLFRVARRTDSMALEADAWHLWTDVFTSAGVVAALGIMWVGAWLFPAVNLQWIDPVAAIMVALLILKAAWDLTWKAAHDLMDSSLPVNEEDWIRDYVRQVNAKVRGFHGLRTRKAGAERFIDFHLVVDRSMSVEQSHSICDAITRDLRQRFGGGSVTIHVEPCDGYCSDRCVGGCFLSVKERNRVRRRRENRIVRALSLDGAAETKRIDTLIPPVKSTGAGAAKTSRQG